MGRRFVPTILLCILPATAIADALMAERVSAWLADRAAEHFARTRGADRVGDALGEGMEPFGDRRLHAAVDRIYGKARGRLQFVDGGVLTPAGEELLAILRTVEHHGVGSLPYAPRELDARLRRYETSLASFRRPRTTWAPPPGWTLPAKGDGLPAPLVASLERAKEAAERHVATARALDVHLVAGLARLVDDLGLADGRSVAARTRAALAIAKSPRAALDERLPAHPQYALLVEGMRRYLALWRGPAPPSVPRDRVYVRGDRSPDVAALRERLAWEGFLPEAGGATFDDVLELGLRSFQRSRGLPQSGAPDGPTLAALNRPPSWWVRRLAFALASWRSSETDEIGDTYVRVNVPEFRLEVFEEGDRTLEMDVLVGQPHTPTYELESILREIKINPSWNVPKGVQRREIEPRIAEDPSFLEANHFVERGRGARARYVQKPGPWNWLGRAIIPFYNKKGLALHGSRRDHLMSKAQRAYSNGCVNLADEIAFVRYLLDREENPARDQLDAWLEGWKTHRIRLRKPIPLLLDYETVTVDDEGRVRFLPDVYRKDGAELTRVSLDTFWTPGVAAQP